jgi:hypothetical protein
MYVLVKRFSQPWYVMIFRRKAMRTADNPTS